MLKRNLSPDAEPVVVNPPAAEPIAAPVINPPTIEPIDMAALGAPEGASKDSIDILRQNEAAPVIEPAKAPEPAAAAPAEPAAAPVPDANNKPVVPTGKEVYQTVFDKVKAYTGNEDIKLPEDINDENFVEKLAEVILANTESGSDTTNLHPAAAQLQKLIDNKVPLEEAIKQLDQISYLSAVDHKNLYKNYLTESFGKTEANPGGWDEAKINETLDKMEKGGTLEVEAEKLRLSLKNHALQEQQQKLSEQQTQKAAATAQNIQDSQTKRVQLQKEALQKFDLKDNILGLPISKADKLEFKENFLYLTTPGEDGIAPGVKLLQSNDNFADALYLLTKGNEKIKAAISEAKEKTKSVWMKGLDLEPVLSNKIVDRSDSTIDLDKMAQEEKFIVK